MTWYNKNHLTSETFNKFYLHGNLNNLSYIGNCYQESIIGEPDLQESEQVLNKNLFQLESQLKLSWNFFEEFQKKCYQEGMLICCDSHLKGHQKSPEDKKGKPYYAVCFYISYVYKKSSYRVLNLDIRNSGINIEIRHPISEIFSIDIFKEEAKDIKVGWQNNLPKLELFKNIEQHDILMNQLIDYIRNIKIFLDNGGKLNPKGQSKAETILYNDLINLYQNRKGSVENWIRHGQRPISNPNGNPLEIDIQIDLTQDVKLAIEIQGRHHYPCEYKNNQQWDNVEQKHQTKIKWCAERKIIFVWLDWVAFNNVVVKQRSSKSRQKLIANMIFKIISMCKNENFYVEIFEANNDLTFSTIEKRKMSFSD